MRKNYIYLIFAFLTAFCSFAQKVVLTPATVNGAAFGGTINLGGTPYSSITLGVRVEMPTIPDNNGTVTVYTVSGLNPAVAIGGNSVPILFNGAKAATQNFVINISWGSISSLGGQVYAEYKTSGGITYKSNYVAVTKSGTMSGGGNPQAPGDAPNPSNIANTLCCNQTIRLGDKPAPITGSQYSNPYQNEPYGINSSWSGNGNGSVRFSSIDNTNQVLDIDYVTEPGNFTITRSLGYNYSSSLSNKSNSINITVVPSPILLNDISSTEHVNSDGFIEIISTNPKKIYGTRQDSQVNLNILQNPSHISQRGDIFREIERFEWQYAKTNKGIGGNLNWISINSNHPYDLEFFNPSDQISNEDNYYLLRRIAIYQNIKKVSNTLKLVLRDIKNNNTICCDQLLSISASGEINSPSPITGSIANQYSFYQWQSQSIDNTSTTKLGSWTNIIGATLKDYTPAPLQVVSSNNRGREISWSAPINYNYRRLTISQNSYEPTSYSNEVNLSSSSYKYLEQGLVIYPNPTTSTISIEKKGTLFNMETTTFRITNVYGLVVNLNNYSIISPNIINVDVSNLPFGMYFINFDTTDRRSTQATFMKN